ncbi:helix-turn-helix transcriptional regulator [Kineosporia sp. J2-2]|uniref:Helix-turn-helix transcriptional regulator n=1 Tax=Kineosporia corallincola TaxID=2835133 RepID=A0ABS5TBF3_9ACTN|nr:XRE family transcriptional regulator [Kineosporia corallincola]MBT0768406.1 helix-turn-helix transcriptional regulator [Kineosporia corallincola]
MEAITVSDTQQMLGARIRQVRRARGLTLIQLADAAGLTHGFLSKLERGLASPSMASLAQIALALGTSQVELLAGSGSGSGPAPGGPTGHHEPPAAARAPGPVRVQRSGEGVSGPYGLGRARLLTSGDRRLQPMLSEGENTDPGEYFQHDEDEFVHVIAGRVLVDLGPGDVVTLGPGDSLYLGGGTPHRWSTGGPQPYQLFIVKENPQAR